MEHTDCEDTPCEEESLHLIGILIPGLNFHKRHARTHVGTHACPHAHAHTLATIERTARLSTYFVNAGR